MAATKEGMDNIMTEIKSLQIQMIDVITTVSGLKEIHEDFIQQMKQELIDINTTSTLAVTESKGDILETAANEADCKNLRLVMLNAILLFLLCEKINKANDDLVKRMLGFLFNL